MSLKWVQFRLEIKDMFEPSPQREGLCGQNVVLAQLEALISDGNESFLGRMASLANASALLWQSLERINWVGFYLVGTETAGTVRQLILGPFQGPPACVSIAYGKGVCGTAWQKTKTLVVPDVHAFPGHISCDSASRSEVVVPMVVGLSVVGVLDVDSPDPDRFSSSDVDFLEKAAKIVSRIYPSTLT